MIYCVVNSIGQYLFILDVFDIDEEKKREKRERRELEDNMWVEKRKKIIICYLCDLKKVIFEGYESK